MIKNLRTVNFYDYAKVGKAYVYVYLRQSNYSPYYVRVASNGCRPIDKKHVIKPPIDRSLIRVLRHNLTKAQALLWERFFIAKYGRKDLGTGMLRNLSDGGEGNFGYVHREETKAKIGASIKGRKQTPEWLERRINKIRGQNNGMYGRTHSLETREKMSKAHKGKLRGPMPPEQRQKLSEAKKGKPVPWLNKPRTAEQIEKQSQVLRAFHKSYQEQRAAERGVIVPELLKLEKKERNQRSYAKWREKQAQQRQGDVEAL